MGAPVNRPEKIWELPLCRFPSFFLKSWKDEFSLLLIGLPWFFFICCTINCLEKGAKHLFAREYIWTFLPKIRTTGCIIWFVDFWEMYQRIFGQIHNASSGLPRNFVWGSSPSSDKKSTIQAVSVARPVSTVWRHIWRQRVYAPGGRSRIRIISCLLLRRLCCQTYSVSHSSRIF